jgi:hypothetical protein
VAADREAWAKWIERLELLGGALAVAIVLLLVRRALRRRGIGGLASGFEGQLANPLVPFAAFALVVVLSTYMVWFLEHDSNTKLRTLNDSFWEMNTFATGNFNAETLKTSTARVVGATATILGLGLLAWFTATLTNIFAQDQTRLWRRLRGHLVVLNFREDMLPLIRLLRSPGPSRLRSLHVVVPDALPKRVRLQLGKIKSLTIHYDNPEVPENLATLRLPRASRVIVLGGEADRSGTSYDPLRIARAVHQACARDPLSLAAQGKPGHAAGGDQRGGDDARADDRAAGPAGDARRGVGGRAGRDLRAVQRLAAAGRQQAAGVHVDRHRLPRPGVRGVLQRGGRVQRRQRGAVQPPAADVVPRTAVAGRAARALWIGAARQRARRGHPARAVPGEHQRGPRQAVQRARRPAHAAADQSPADDDDRGGRPGDRAVRGRGGAGAGAAGDPPADVISSWGCSRS